MVLNTGSILESPGELLKLISVRALLQNNLIRIYGGGTLFLLVLAIALHDKCYHPHFPDEETEAQRGEEFFHYTSNKKWNKPSPQITLKCVLFLLSALNNIF